MSCRDQTYPLEPTFCDDWCRATLVASCDEDPEDCVENCELTKASGDCFTLQAGLLSCYEGADRDAFACAGEGFRSEVRVRPDVCASERDALFECVSPGIGQCLTLCRTAQGEQLANATLTTTGQVVFDPPEESAGAAASCPSITQPCEELCWSMFGLQSDGLESLGLGSEAGGLSGTFECLQTTLLGCFADQSGASEDGGVAADVEPPPGESAAAALARCRATITGP